MNFTTGSHALVIQTAGGVANGYVAGDPRPDLGVDALGGHINLTGFTANDLIYMDNMGDMSMWAGDGRLGGAYWTDAGGPVTRYQEGDLQQNIVFTDYGSTGWTVMGNLNYGQGDGRFENATHHNANVIIFG